MTHGTSSQADLVDMDKMVSSITREINAFWSAYESHNENKPFLLQRVPQHILRLDRHSYEPIILSIGPHHHGAPNLVVMEKEKWKSLDYILKLNCEVSLQDYIRAVSKVEKKVRSCYSEKIMMDKMKFLRMLLLDSCFILVKVDGTVTVELALKGEHTGVAAQNTADIDGEEIENSGEAIESVTTMDGHTIVNFTQDIELTKSYSKQMEAEGSKRKYDQSSEYLYDQNVVGDWYSNSAWHDLFLLENQIPFFVVETVYEPKVRYFHHLVQLEKKYFGVNPKQEETERHLLHGSLDCFQAGQLPSRWRQAIQYHEAGVELKKREYQSYDSHSLLDIKFSNGVVEVPCFPIDENTESLFKNLIAFKQTDPQFGNDITAYIIFMSQFVSTVEDATLLTQRGIIIHLLDSDDEVPALFNRLSKQVSFASDCNYYLKSLSHILEAHYQSRLNRWMAWLWRNHFSNPWLALTVFAAVIILVYCCSDSIHSPSVHRTNIILFPFLLIPFV